MPKICAEECPPLINGDGVLADLGVWIVCREERSDWLLNPAYLANSIPNAREMNLARETEVLSKVSCQAEVIIEKFCEPRRGPFLPEIGDRHHHPNGIGD